MKREVDIVVLSDVHLGTRDCHAKALYNYLKRLKVGTLILNGDFIDTWAFRRHYFPREHTLVLQRIMRMAAKGTQVYYITGNHDDVLRRYSDFSAGNLHLRDQLVLQLNGKRYWFFHGDVFDAVIRFSPLLTKMGSQGYEWLIRLNRWINRLRRITGRPRMSFASRVKHSVKKATTFIHDFEQTAIRTASEQNCDYVVCGHIHRPTIRTAKVEDKTITYLNSGDWVENLTALEYNFGRWTIYEYNELDYDLINPKLRADIEQDYRIVMEDLRAEANLSAPVLFKNILSALDKQRPTAG